MIGKVETPAKGSPEEFSAKAIVHVSDSESGSIRVECRLPDGYSAEDVERHLRLELPGETGLLSPMDVIIQNGQFVVGFFSADVTNADQIPMECVAIWDDGKSHQTRLTNMPVENAAQTIQYNSEGGTKVPGSPGTAYPRTVGIAAILAVIVGGLIGALFLLLN